MSLSQKTRIAVVGTGRVGISHVQGVLKNAEIMELAGIVESNHELADKVAKNYNTRAYYSVEDGLSDPSIDAFIISLPQFLHFPIGKQILEAGRHVLIEKPLGLNLCEVRELIRTADEHNVYVMAAQSRRFYRAIQYAKNLLPEIGGPTNMLYNFACIFTEKTAPPWWREEKKSGGLVLGMLGSHSIDLTLWMNEGKKPISVYAESRNISDVFEGDDASTVIIRFEDGTMATNYLSICNSPYVHECLIEGRNGSIFFKHEGDHVGIIGVSSTAVYLNGERIEAPEEPDCFTMQVKEFVSAIQEGRQPSTSGQNVYSTYLILEAAKESAKRHEVIILDKFDKE